jgi:lysophospholipase L1-like esterase
MKHYYLLSSVLFFLLAFNCNDIYSKALINADNPNIQYYGRWDFSDPQHPKFSWPGVYLKAEFTGTSVGVRLKDNISYYNVYIDGNFTKVFHGSKPEETNYTLASGLANGKHTLVLSKRNISFDQAFVFSGLLIDDDASILPPAAKPERKIEFIGDSFTAAESNESKVQQLSWEERYPVTNIDKGFAPLIAKHFKTQYATTCRSGAGMLCDWTGNYDVTIPKRYDRTLMDSPDPKWDFSKFQPDVIVICLGLNDYTGLKDKEGNVTEENSANFRKTYSDFILNLRKDYPKAKILAVAAWPKWIRDNVKQVVKEAKDNGINEVFYSTFDEFPGGYVVGHPTVDTHKKMADQIIAAMEKFNFFN